MGSFSTQNLIYPQREIYVLKSKRGLSCCVRFPHAASDHTWFRVCLLIWVTYFVTIVEAFLHIIYWNKFQLSTLLRSEFASQVRGPCRSADRNQTATIGELLGRRQLCWMLALRPCLPERESLWAERGRWEGGRPGKALGPSSPVAP